MASVDTNLVQRLWQPVARPGLIDPGPVRSILDRHLGMTAGVPLAESLTRRAHLADGPTPTLPIVLAHPHPLPTPESPATTPTSGDPTSPTAANLPRTTPNLPRTTPNLPPKGERAVLHFRGQVRTDPAPPPSPPGPPLIILRRVDPSAPNDAVRHSTPNPPPKEGASSLFRGQVRREGRDTPPAPAGAEPAVPVIRPVVAGRVVPAPPGGALPLASPEASSDGVRPAPRPLTFGSDDRPVVRPLPVVAERPGAPASPPAADVLVPHSPNGHGANGHGANGHGANGHGANGDAPTETTTPGATRPVVRVPAPAPAGIAAAVPVPPDPAALPVVLERVQSRPAPDGRGPLAMSRSSLPLAGGAPTGAPGAALSRSPRANVTGYPGVPARPGTPVTGTTRAPGPPGPPGPPSAPGSPTSAARPPRDRPPRPPAAPEADTGRIANAVHKRFLRQLAIEGERRGVR